MAYFEIQGIPIPTSRLEAGEATAGGEGLGDAGFFWRSDAGGALSGWQYSSPPVARATALVLQKLLSGEGEVWSDSDYGCKGTQSITSMATSSSAKFGTHHFDPPSAPDDFVLLTDVPGLDDLDDGWTVFMWYDSGGGYTHYGLTSKGTQFVGGAVDNGASLPFSVTAGTLSLDSAGDYDDIVVLPYVFPTDWIGNLDLTVAWAKLPSLNAGGDFWFKALELEAVGSVEVVPIGRGTDYTVRVELLERKPGLTVLSPADMTDVSVWYDATDATTLWQDSGRTTQVTADGDTVEAWDDKSGNGRHATNASGTAVFRDEGLNGRPSIEVTGVATENLVSSAFSHGTTGGLSIFSAFKNDDASGTHYLSYRSGTIRVTWAVDAGTGVGPGFYDGAHKAFAAETVTDANAFCVIFESGGTARLYRQGTEIGTGTAYTDFADASAAIVLFGNTSPMNGDVGEYILINREVTAAERAGLLNYLAQKWGFS